jgi:hypothetical protein
MSELGAKGELIVYRARNGSEFVYDAPRNQWTDGEMVITAEEVVGSMIPVTADAPTAARGSLSLSDVIKKRIKPRVAPSPPSRPPQRPAVVPDSSKVSRSSSSMIGHERDSNGLSRVRVGRVREVKGSVNGHQMLVVTTQYLDGHTRAVADAGSYHDEQETTFDAVPSSGEDIANFSRLSKVMSSLVVSMSLPDSEVVGPEQVAIFIAGHGNLQAWQRRVAEQMSQAQGEMEVVEAMLRTML